MNLSEFHLGFHEVIMDSFLVLVVYIENVVSTK